MGAINLLHLTNSFTVLTAALIFCVWLFPDHDTYSQGSCEAAQILGIPEPVEITIWVDKSEDLATVTVRCDHSIVAVDNPAGGGKVDIYNSLYGSPDVPAGSVIVTIQ